MKIPVILLFGLIFMFKPVIAQVTVAPVFVFMDDRNRFGSMTIINGSNQAQEISVDFLFGYLSSDQDGNGLMIYDDSLSAVRYGATDWLRAFPRTFVLEAGQRQTVRINARPPAQLEDGMYWTRVRTTSNPQTALIEQTEIEGVTTQISFRFEQNTALFYSKGNLQTGIEIAGLSAERNENGYSALVDIKRIGNTPFLGTVITRLRDVNNNTVSENRAPVSIYFDGLRRYNAALQDLPHGQYTLEVRFESQRGDMASQNIVQIQPVSQTIQVQL
jgi:hypothetical protein